MPAKRNQQLLIDAARMYYLDGLDQGEVARRLGISRSNVSRILASARASGIVQISINGVEQIPRNRKLEQRLCHRFELDTAMVVDKTNKESSLNGVAELGAQFFTEHAPNVAQIGFSWGHTIGRLIEVIPHMNLKSNVAIAPLVGGMPTLDTTASGNSHMQTIADKCRTVAHRFDAPAIVESRATWAAMNSESTVQNSLQHAAQTDLAFVGIGSYGVQTSALVSAAMKLSPAEQQVFQAAKPAGDMCGHFYDLSGTALGPPVSERVIGITLDQLAAIPTVVGLAAGAEKTPGVLGALRSGALNVIVLDQELAEEILNSDDQIWQ